ncbi:MAG: hypothetical protein HY756_06925 [Nitrospirae bacterium]|nr:hypothetical protein [Nitrospirota bacterium]
MNYENIGGINIYRPQIHSELIVRERVQRHLYSKYAVGEYDDKPQINEIIQHQFSYYFTELNRLIPLIARSDFLHFLLFQYDQSAEIDSLYKDRALAASEDKRWSEIGPIMRRTIKYLAERSVLLEERNAKSPLNDEALSQGLDFLWICAEETVNLYLLSDQTYMVFPDATALKILPPENLKYFVLDVTNNCQLAEDVRRDTENRERYVGQAVATVIYDIQEHDKAIGAALKNSIGISYLDAFSVLYRLIDSSVPDPDGFPVLNIKKDYAIEILSSASGFPLSAVEKAIEGFTIRKEDMLKEGREVWKPKQEFRAYRRGFFEVDHAGDKHLCFSRNMAKECLIQLNSEIVFKQIPVEWQSASVMKSVEVVSNKAGAWFENIVFDNFKTINIPGLKSQKNGIGIGSERISIPPEVGEIDFIGYSPLEKILVLAECKLVRSGAEPKFFRDDIYDFISSKKSYLTKFNKKYTWIKDNLTAVCRALESAGVCSSAIAPEQIKTVIITHYPSVVQCLIDTHHCVSLAIFMSDCDRVGKWPY